MESSNQDKIKNGGNNRDSPSNEAQLEAKKSHQALLGEISKKDFYDFMRTAYQLYECVEGNNEMPNAQTIDWDDLEKNPVIKMILENSPVGIDDGAMRRGSEGGTALEAGTSTNFSSGDPDTKDQNNTVKGKKGDLRRNSVSTFGRRSIANKRDLKTDPEESFIDSALKSKLSDILNEGVLDSVLPYMVGQSKIPKPTNFHQPVIKKNASSGTETKKSTSFTESKEKSSMPSRINRRKSSTGGDKILAKGDGEVEIHVCDEVKGMKKDFKCPQKLLVSKMGYFADVTSGQKLEDMDISVHCDIQIFDWLMRWVKKDSILEADWPQLDPTNVVPILVSASFLQMDPLLHDCLMYCHTNMCDIVKTNTNLACLNDTILTRLGAMYTNTELEEIKDRKDKIQSRLFCKMIMSLGEPVFETLRGHYASLATLYKCCKCNKLLPRQIANRVPCVPSSMILDRWGNILSSHTRDLSWNLSEYITSLYGELKSWRKVYWKLWGDCHFLKCIICDNHFPVNQMQWCCYHADVPQFFSLEPVRPTCLPVGRYPCCGERAYRFQVLNNNSQGCQFREHNPEQKTDHDIAIFTIYNEFKDVIQLEAPHLVFPEKLIKLVARESNEENGRLIGREVFWWDGLKLAPPRQPLGLLGKLYSGSSVSKTQVTNKAQPADTVSLGIGTRTMSMIQLNTSSVINTDFASSISSTFNNVSGDVDSENNSKSLASGSLSMSNRSNEKEKRSKVEIKDVSSSESDDVEESDASSAESSHSEESSPPHSPAHRRGPLRSRPRFLTRRRGGGRQWAATLSARSNQDQQRQYEERAARQMRSLLARRAAVSQPKQMQPLGGVYVRLEAEWREANLPPAVVSQRPVRHLYSAKGMKMKSTK